MSTRTIPLTTLAEMPEGQEVDLFLLLVAKEESTTRDGKPYFRVSFRDASGEVGFPIWNDSAWATPCRNEWQAGMFFKLRAIKKVTNYGAQLDLKKVRQTCEADVADGFDPMMCLPRSRFPPEPMFAALVELVNKHVEAADLKALVLDILQTNRAQILTLPAATHHHHAFMSGFLEHVLSVTRTAVYLADKYREYYSDLETPISKDLLVAGAVLHDIGKLRELELKNTGGAYTPEGDMIGHILQGRDIVREFATKHPLDRETMLRLEHIIVSHQRTAEWGSPKPPMTPEALLVHYADDIDAKLNMMLNTLADDTTPGPMTSKKNMLQQKLFKGLGEEGGEKK